MVTKEKVWNLISEFDNKYQKKKNVIDWACTDMVGCLNYLQKVRVKNKNCRGRPQLKYMRKILMNKLIKMKKNLQ